MSRDHERISAKRPAGFVFETEQPNTTGDRLCKYYIGAKYGLTVFISGDVWCIRSAFVDMNIFEWA